MVHDGLPGAFREQRVLRGQTGSEDELIVTRIGGGLAFEFQNAVRDPPVLGVQGLLFSRPGILPVIGAAAAEEIEPLSHNCMIRTGRKTPLGYC